MIPRVLSMVQSSVCGNNEAVVDNPVPAALLNPSSSHPIIANSPPIQPRYLLSAIPTPDRSYMSAAHSVTSSICGSSHFQRHPLFATRQADHSVSRLSRSCTLLPPKLADTLGSWSTTPTFNKTPSRLHPFLSHPTIVSYTPCHSISIERTSFNYFHPAILFCTLAVLRIILFS